MVRPASILCLLAAFSVGLSACKEDTISDADANKFPAQYQSEILETLRKHFEKNQTTKVRNALISDPALRPVGKDHRYTVCVRYTAFGADPGVTANVERVGYFYAGQLNQLIEATEGQCAGAAYKPWTDLNDVCIGRGCR